MRISDVCTRLDDAMTIAAFYQALLGYLYRLRRDNQRWRVYSPGIIEENVWRAQRYGTGGTLVDFGKGALVPFPDLIEELIEIIAQDAVEFEVEDEIRRARDIIAEGTSADRQIAAYRGAIDSGASEREALQAVVDELIADTLHGIAT
jgi:carboxylate-amine ligase